MLADYLGGERIAGGKLKETGTTHWARPNTGATNESGFTALPGGARSNYDGEFGDIGIGCYWWSSKEFTSALVSTFGLYSKKMKYSGTLYEGSWACCSMH
jgi:uncharacterized protein (TIGR02145 family)